MTADELAKILDELGQRLGPTGSHVFELAVRQVVINNGILVIWGLMALAGGGWVIRRVLSNPDDGSYSDDGLVLVLGISVAVVGIVLLGWGGSNLLNPEYAAIRDLLGAIR